MESFIQFLIQYFLELQTLVWFLESLSSSSFSTITSSSTPSSVLLSIENIKIELKEFNVLKQLCPCFSVMLDVRLYGIISQNLSNSFKSLNLNWESKTLMRFLFDPYCIESLSHDDDNSYNTTSFETPKLSDYNQYELQMNGSIRQLQSPIIELLLRVLNLTSLNIPISSSDLVSQMILSSSSSSSSFITVSTFHEINKRTFKIFHQVIQNSNELIKLSQ